VIFTVPYSSTTYWKAGAKEGPHALIDASRRIELYDTETKKDVSRAGIFTLEPLEPSKNSPQETIERVEKVVSQLLRDKKFVITIGGEHSIALGAVRVFAKKIKNLSVLQFDAHTDSRYEFEGTKYHHGCVIRRIRELRLPVTQVGIRSVSEEEAEYIKKEKIKTIFYTPELPINKIISTLKEQVYITFDLDVFDPSIMPSTGTPEPGGLGWRETLKLIKEISKKRKIVGADVVELDPIPGLHHADFLAAKLVYKIIAYCR
jgi:agmatinase